MNKAELVAAVAAKTGASKKDITAILDATITTIQGEVAAGERVAIPGFGTWERRHRAARTVNNPAIGGRVHVAAKHVPTWKPSASFKIAVIKAGIPA